MTEEKLQLTAEWDKTFPKSDAVHHEMAINAAALDPRIKATVASTMYDMARIAAKGYFDENDSAEERQVQRRALATQRTRDYAAGTYERAGGVVDPLHGDAAHSCYMGRDAFAQLRDDNKELVLVSGAVHTDLYDGGGKNAIPWDQIQAFFERYL